MTDIRPSFTALDSPALKNRLEQGDVALIDVRTPAEFEAAHIPGSLNLPLDKLGAHLDELSRGLCQPAVLICRSGNRAGQAERILAAAGVDGIQVLDGGILAWERAGGAVHRGRQRWDLERQVRFVAGAIVLASVLASIAYEPAKWIAGAIGIGLTTAALTNSCLMGMLLAKLPYNQGATCDTGAVVAQLRVAPSQVQA
jgi:rhodanese-related sulfurtransferase